MWFRYASASAAAEIEGPARGPAAEEASLRRKLWRKLLREAANVPFLEDVLTAHYCAFDRNTPFYVKAVLVGAITYFIVPTDLIPDYIPVIGFSDDAAVVGAAVKMVATHIKPEHREAAQRTMARLRGELPSRHR